MLSISIRFLLELVHRNAGIFFDAKSVLIISQRKMCIVDFGGCPFLEEIIGTVISIDVVSYERKASLR